MKPKREKPFVPAKPLDKLGAEPPKPKIDPWNKLQWESWAQLMKRVQAGDQEAYRQFLDEIGPVLFNFVRRRVFNPEMVRDVYQEVLLTLHKARHTYETSRPLGPWLFTVTRNSILDALGKNRKFAEREVPMEILPESSELERDGTLDDQLFQALQTLPESNREAVELLKLKGLSLEEAAKKMGISVAALKGKGAPGLPAIEGAFTGKRNVSPESVKKNKDLTQFHQELMNDLLSRKEPVNPMVSPWVSPVRPLWVRDGVGPGVPRSFG